VFNDRILYALAVVFYGVSLVYSVFLWRRGFRQDDRTHFGILLFGFVLNTVALCKRGIYFDRCPVNNLYEAMVFLTWTIAGVCNALNFAPKLRFVGVFASPVLFSLGVFALMPSLDVKHGGHPNFANGPTSLHAALIILAYGAFGLACVAGLMFLTQENDLKRHKTRALLSKLPSIQKLEQTIGRLMVAGFVLLTAGLVVGAIWVPLPEGKTYFGDLKVIWSAGLWLLYLSLMVLRWGFAQRGRRFAWGAVAGFAIIVLTFWGANLGSALHQP
jgi:ABC-type transport system involved in cytochrome c biogenesis permease subunit